MKERKVIMNSHELKKGHNIRKEEVFNDANLNETAFMKVLVGKKIYDLTNKAEKYKEELNAFANQYQTNTLLTIQSNQEKGLTKELIKAIDFIQDTPSCKLKLIYQESDNNTLEEFVTRINEAKNKFGKNQCIPLIYLNGTTIKNRDSLQKKTLWLVAQGYKKIGLVYRNWKQNLKAFIQVSEILEANECEDIYWFNVPGINKDTYATLLIPFVLGATKVVLAGKYPPTIDMADYIYTPHFVEKNWVFSEGFNASEGSISYGKTRLEHLKLLTGKDIEGLERYDFILQSTEMLKEYELYDKLTEIETLSKIRKHFFG
jgi:hypothetical protein